MSVQYIKDRISVREGVYKAIKQRFIKGNIYISGSIQNVFSGVTGGYERIQFAIPDRIEVVQRLRHPADTDRFSGGIHFDRISFYCDMVYCGRTVAGGEYRVCDKGKYVCILFPR